MVKKYYYYDINFRLTNDQVFIEIPYDFNIINYEFDVLYHKILQFYQIKDYNKYIDEIHIFYIDHYFKIRNNYIYYYF